MNYTRDEEVIKRFGKRLKELRETKELSLRKLADIADVDFSEIHRLEKGESNPTLTMIVALAEALEINPCEFLKT